jgi:predicted nucleic acid-binding protein
MRVAQPRDGDVTGLIHAAGVSSSQASPATAPAAIAVGTLIDSSVLIAAERLTLDLDADLGAYARQTFLERLLAVLPVFPFDLGTPRIHASLWAGLASKGAPRFSLSRRGPAGG